MHVGVAYYKYQLSLAIWATPQATCSKDDIQVQYERQPSYVNEFQLPLEEAYKLSYLCNPYMYKVCIVQYRLHSPSITVILK